MSVVEVLSAVHSTIKGVEPFIVEWDSDKVVSIPLIESIMLGTLGTKGFSFSSRGKEIEAH